MTEKLKMKHWLWGLGALICATAAAAEDGPSAPPAAEPTTPAAAAPAEPVTPPPAHGAKPAAPALAAKPKLHVGGRAKAYVIPHKDYAKILASEIRRHTPKISSSHPGAVTVAFTVGASGRVVSHRVKHASNPALVAAVDRILSSIQTPPPPGGSFSAEQEFRFR
jgi:hypothetical protein